MNHYHYLMIAVATALLGLFPHPLQSIPAADGYTFSEVMAAYEAGQFRVIYTGSISLLASPDGAYVAAAGDGVYRLSDGLFFPQYDNAVFSPDSLYVAQENDGVYRLSDGQKMFDIGALPRFTDDGKYLAAEGYGIFRMSDGQKLLDINDSDVYTDGYVYSFYSHFSPPGNYVVVDKDGVYRLSDRHKILSIVSEGLYVTFSPDEQYVTYDGVYRLSDGQKMFDIHGSAVFSPDMAYVAALGDALYRLSDGHKLFDLGRDSSLLDFSPDGQYMTAEGDGLYRLSDSQKLLDIPEGATFSPDGQYVVVWQDGAYRLSDGHKLFDLTDGSYPDFSADGTYVAAHGDGLYRLSDGQKLFDIPYAANFSPDDTSVAVGTVGLYRIRDAQKLFDIEGVITHFSPDGAYISASSIGEDSVYRVSDGYRYRYLRILDAAAGVMAVGNAILVVDPTQHGQQAHFVQADFSYLLSEPAKDSNLLIHINADLLLMMVDEDGAWSQVSYNGVTGWVPSDSITPFSLPE